ncbi:putative receptor-type tyrosine-protein phosphatase [Coemansia sp. RSA 922]|nr:positive regulation of Schwann cell migration [Coemansia sp. S16]KAJ2112872.1 putative receptor-type tyrosine-protein phosphatase [Coemansia sp. RSA 922]KAJ2343093.1 positive regulation of Schwann cell migration [Coemansia sp. RSA 2673]
MTLTSFRQIVESLASYETQQALSRTYHAASRADSERMTQAMEQGGTAQSDIGDSQRGRNYDLNRYCNVVPFNHNRVRLSGKHDYINATHITMPHSANAYIATQGPLNHSTGDFWRMVWEQQVRAIVMLANPIEKLQNKCAVYWPVKLNETMAANGLTVCLADERPLEGCLSVIVRKVRLTMAGEERLVTQLHYTEWPDHGVPQSPVPMVRIMKEIRSRVSPSPHVPVVVHCSAGVGRTGTFIILDAARQYFAQNQDYPGDYVADALISLRQQRTLMVQTFEQYMLCYQTINYMFNNRD